MQSFESQEVKETIQILFDKARINQDWVINAEQLRHLVVFLQRMDQFMEETIGEARAAMNMLEAYMNEYGESLRDELLGNNNIVEDVVEAVIEGEVFEDAEGSDDAD